MAGVSRMVYQTEETRNRILACAQEVFVARGFFDAQMKDIAEAVGMSRHTLYRYYQNKVDLGMAIASAMLEAHSQRMYERARALSKQTERSGLDRLTEFLLRDAMGTITGEDGRFLAEFDAYFSNERAPPDFRDRLVQGWADRSLDAVVGLIEAGRQDGSLRQDFDEKQLIKILIGLRAVQKEVLLRGELLWGIDEGDVDKVPEELAKLMLAGLSGQLT